MENEGLEALKIIKNELKFYFQDEWDITRYPKNIEIIEKSLKALEVIAKTLDIRVYMNEMGQCFLEDNHCIYAIPRSTYDLLKEVLK